MSYFNQLLKHSGIKLGAETGTSGPINNLPVSMLEQDERVVAPPFEDPNVTSPRLEQAPIISSVNSELFPSKEVSKEVNSAQNIEQDHKSLSPKEQGKNLTASLDNSRQVTNISPAALASKEIALPNTYVQREEIIQRKAENTETLTQKIPAPVKSRIENFKSRLAGQTNAPQKILDVSKGKSNQLTERGSQSQTWQGALAQARAWVSTPTPISEAQEKTTVLPPSYSAAQKESSHTQKTVRTTPPQENLHHQELQLSIGTISLTVEAPPEKQLPKPKQPKQTKPITNKQTRLRLSRYYLRER